MRLFLLTFRWLVVTWLWIAPLSLCAQTTVPPNVIQPLPPQTPAWLEGFQVRWPVRVIGLASEQPTAMSVIVSLPTGGWLAPDAADLAVVTAAGKTLPIAVLSHHTQGETIIQFPREANDCWFWVYGVGGSANLRSPPTNAKDNAALRAGIVVEGRAWKEGSPQDSWTAVRTGLEAAGPALANGIVAEVVQYGNPTCPAQPQQYAASYRGYLEIAKEGTYRFLANGDGATFLFIDGFKVYERLGDQRLIGHAKVSELDKLAGKIDLTAGIHPFEVHQVVGPNPTSTGSLSLLWSPPEQTKFVPVPAAAFARPMYARVAATELRKEAPRVWFTHGMDDLLEVGGLKLFLIRYEAHGDVPDDKIVWEMGDKTTRRGRSIVHPYFQDGSYTVSLAAGNLPQYQRQVHVWPEPGELSPLSLQTAVFALAEMEWAKLPANRVREMFTFLQACEQPNRWPLLFKVADFLLQQPDLDLETRAQLLAAKIEALAAQDRAAEALALAKESQPLFAKTPALAVRILLATADVQQTYLKDLPAASAIYKNILEENSRVEHPNLRIAGVRYGDLFAELGNLEKASETYRLAATLGGDKAGGKDADPAARGAILRIAEQKLKGGEYLQTRQLLQRLELEFPGRRLDGLYCFLRAETDRLSGRYDDALRHYEMIFRLPQWAGYRDRATWGIAETYLRAGELVAAKKWFATLKESFPKLYEEKKCAEQVALLERRLKRLSADETQPFSEMTINLEPHEDPWGIFPHGSPVVRGSGMSGEQLLLCDTYPKPIVYYDWYRPLKGLSPGTTYLLEFWWKDIVWTPPPESHQTPFVGFHLIREAETGDGISANQAINRGVHHQWHKVAIRLKSPQFEDGQFKVRLNNLTGAFVFDRLTIRPVSDQQLDALTLFLESGKGQ